MKHPRLPAAAIVVVAVFVVAVFLALNYRAYDGYFQDDELDNISWTPHVSPRDYLAALATPLFSTANFRPAGHAYFGLMGNYFGLNFPPYMTPIFAFHILNGVLLFFLLRKLQIGQWHALGAAAFFLLSAAAFDAYWKPMYVFDLLCTTFSLATLLTYVSGRKLVALLFYWLAYKSKELAVMLPAVLFLYEYWLGERRYLKLIPFFLASLSFGLQGIFLNPNQDNDYSFRFGTKALAKTIPFYVERFWPFPLFFGLAWFKDRRIWLGLSALVLVAVPLAFLPGRLYGAYLYLPLACATIAIAAASTHVKPQWALAALLLWLPFNIRQQHRELKAKLAFDDDAYPFVETVQQWSAKHPEVKTFVYTGAPAVYHHWGVTAAWNLAHNTLGLRALFLDWPEARQAMSAGTVAFGVWDSKQHKLLITTRTP